MESAPPHEDDLDLVALDMALHELDTLRANLRARLDRWHAAQDEQADGWEWFEPSERYEHQPPHGSTDILVAESLQDYVLEREESFNSLFDGFPFEFEYETHFELLIYPADERLPAVSRRRLVHEWFAGLVAPDLAGVYAGVFDYFAGSRAAVEALPWRALEELVGATFEANGFSVKLGSGRSDEGIDLHLVEHQVYGDVLTSVQVKSGNTKVRLHYVQALAAASLLEGSDRSLFVASARYLPGVTRWAARWNERQVHQITLATSSDVSGWAQAAASRVWAPTGALNDPQPRGTGELVGRILSAHHGSRSIYNLYALVLRQTPSAVLLRRLSKTRLTGDLHRGTEVPVMPSQPVSADQLFSARLFEGDNERNYYAENGYLYSLWTGGASFFDYMD